MNHTLHEAFAREALGPQGYKDWKRQQAFEDLARRIARLVTREALEKALQAQYELAVRLRRVGR